MRRTLSWILALLAPVALGGLALRAVLALPPPPQVRRDLENGGRMLNGRVADAEEGLAGALAERFAAGAPPVLVLGNSYASTDVDPEALAVALGRKPGEVGLLALPSSVGAHWYAVLARHVWREGVPGPEHVILIGSAQSLLQTRPGTEGAWLSLGQLGYDPEIDGRVGFRSPTLERARAGRTRIRGRVMDAARDASVSLVAPKLAPNAGHLLSRAFADERMDRDRAAERWGEAEAGKGWRPDELPTVEESFVGPIAEVVAAHGARLTVVRVPISPKVPAWRGDLAPPASLDALRDLLGDGWLDLSGIPFPAWAFVNLDHLGDEGRDRFTAILGAALKERRGADLFGPNPTPAGWRMPERAWTLARAERPPTPIDAVRQPDGLLVAPNGDLDLTDLATRKIHPRTARCSPWRVVGPSGMLPGGIPCTSVGAVREATCHGRAGLSWASPGSGPWALALDPVGACDGAAWLYPGDGLSAAWAPRGAPSGALELALRQVRGDEGATVTLRVNGEVRATTRLGTERLTIRLDPPVPADARAWIEVRNGDGWGLLTRAALVP